MNKQPITPVGMIGIVVGILLGIFGIVTSWDALVPCVPPVDESHPGNLITFVVSVLGSLPCEFSTGRWLSLFFGAFIVLCAAFVAGFAVTPRSKSTPVSVKPPPPVAAAPASARPAGIYCSQCGAPNAVDANFCGRCGSAIHRPATAERKTP
jgi:ribosomal protein L40E